MVAVSSTIRVPLPTERSLLLTGVTWAHYLDICEQPELQRYRVIYDRGRLEIMPTSRLHDWIKKTLAQLVEMWCRTTKTRFQAFGSTTNRNQQLERGIDPDECYYIRRDYPDPTLLRVIDPAVDAPPDLAIEVDITSSSIDREPVYAALGVRELLRYEDEQIVSLHLMPDGTYTQHEVGLNLPELPLPRLREWVQIAIQKKDHEAAVDAMLDFLSNRTQ